MSYCFSLPWRHAAVLEATANPPAALHRKELLQQPGETLKARRCITPTRSVLPAVRHTMMGTVRSADTLTSTRDGSERTTRKALNLNLRSFPSQDESIREADERAQEILDERRRRRKESAKRAGEAIANVLIAGDKLIKRFMR